MPGRFDVIVVGGGTVGCVLAARLSEEPERTVCLIEVGPDYGCYADGRWPSDMLDARTLPMSHLWQTEPDDRSASRARILGVARLTTRASSCGARVRTIAGAYGSPAVLMRSGIGLHPQLNRLGVGVVEDLPVGVGLADHPGVGIQVVHRGRARAERVPAFATSLLVRARSDSCPKGTWDLHFLPCAGSSKRTTAGGRAQSCTCSSRTRAAASRCAHPTRVFPRHRPRLPLRPARPRPPLERRRAHPDACRAKRAADASSVPATTRSTRIFDARLGASSTPPAPVRSGRWSIHVAPSLAWRGFSSRMPRSSRRSRVRTRT